MTRLPTQEGRFNNSTRAAFQPLKQDRQKIMKIYPDPLKRVSMIFYLADREENDSTRAAFQPIRTSTNPHIKKSTPRHHPHHLCA